MFQVFVPNVSSIFLDVRCKCFICMLHIFHSMLQVFYLDVTYVCNGFSRVSKCFASISDACYKYFSCFVRILQVFCLNVLKIDWDVEHIACDHPATTTCCSCLGTVYARGGAEGWSTFRQRAREARGDSGRGTGVPTRQAQGARATQTHEVGAQFSKSSIVRRNGLQP